MLETKRERDGCARREVPKPSARKVKDPLVSDRRYEISTAGGYDLVYVGSRRVHLRTSRHALSVVLQAGARVTRPILALSDLAGLGWR